MKFSVRLKTLHMDSVMRTSTQAVSLHMLECFPDHMYNCCAPRDTVDQPVSHDQGQWKIYSQQLSLLLHAEET